MGTFIKVKKLVRKTIHNNIIIFWSSVTILGIIIILSLIPVLTDGKSFWETLFNMFIANITNQSPNIEPGLWYNDMIIGMTNLVGIFITGLVIGTISTVFLDIHTKRRSGMSIPMLVDHTIICGWTDTSMKIIRSIQEEDDKHEIVIICNKESAPVAGERIYWIKGDYTSEDALRRAFVKECKTVIVLADTEDAGGNEDYTDCRSILAVLTIEKLNNKVHTAVELINPDRRSHLEKAGVDEIVVRGDISGSILSRISQNKGLSKVISKLLEFGEGTEFYKVPSPAEFNGKQFGDLLMNLYNEKSYLLIGYEHNNGEAVISPKHSTVLDNPDYLYIISENMPAF
jgi:voltage-gated potassium channel